MHNFAWEYEFRKIFFLAVVNTRFPHQVVEAEKKISLGAWLLIVLILGEKSIKIPTGQLEGKDCEVNPLTCVLAPIKSVARVTSLTWR